MSTDFEERVGEANEIADELNRKHAIDTSEVDAIIAAEEAEKRMEAEEEVRLRAEEDARLQAEEDARLQAEEDARLQAEEDARLQAEENFIAERLQKEEDEKLAAVQAEESARLKTKEDAVAAEDRVEQHDELVILENSVASDPIKFTVWEEIFGGGACCGQRQGHPGGDNGKDGRKQERAVILEKARIAAGKI